MMVAERIDPKWEELDHLLTTAIAMTDALEYYLIEGNIYRVVMVRRKHGFERMIMSLGELLTLLNTVAARRNNSTEEQLAQVDGMFGTVDRVQHQLHDRLHEMVVREIMARLDSINWFLHDCENHKEGCRLAYPQEIHNRQRIEELTKLLGPEITDAVTERIDRIDQRIRQATTSAAFVWPAAMQMLYPIERYWYLYALPQ
ncbi:MAG: hypothetical protein KF832_22365 [Caldilineaceae bacterium]|nr:hypothetical protein [Caldilineaceae bacterium]